MAGDAGWTDLASLAVLATGVAAVALRRSSIPEPQTTRLGLLLLPGLILTGEAHGWLGLVGVACQPEGTRVLPRPRDHLVAVVMVIGAPWLVN